MNYRVIEAMISRETFVCVFKKKTLDFERLSNQRTNAATRRAQPTTGLFNYWKFGSIGLPLAVRLVFFLIYALANYRSKHVINAVNQQQLHANIAVYDFPKVRTYQLSAFTRLAIEAYFKSPNLSTVYNRLNRRIAGYGFRCSFIMSNQRQNEDTTQSITFSTNSCKPRTNL